MLHHGMKSMTPRQHKVASEVQHSAAMALVQGRIPSTLPLERITVVDCWVSADLRLARLFLQVPPESETGIPQKQFFLAANAQLAKPMRKYFASHLATKFIPDPSFWPAEDDLSYPTAQPKA